MESTHLDVGGAIGFLDLSEGCLDPNIDGLFLIDLPGIDEWIALSDRPHITKNSLLVFYGKSEPDNICGQDEYWFFEGDDPGQRDRYIKWARPQPTEEAIKAKRAEILSQYPQLTEFLP